MYMKKDRPNWQAVISGAVAGAGATSLTHPIELLKVRIQMTGELQKGTKGPSMITQAIHIAKAEGLKGMYAGLTAAIARQIVYTGCRFGLYGAISSYVGQQNLFQKIIYSGIAGAVAASFSNPLDLVMVRMQADGRLPVELRRNYRNAFHGIYKISTLEGTKTLWKGASPNIVRAIFVNCSQISSYDTFKTYLIKKQKFTDNFSTHFIASLFAGFMTSVAAAPPDFLRTRYMNSKSHGVGGNVAYTSLMDAIIKIAKTEGILGFYKGWSAYYARVAPQVLALFIFFEQCNNFLDFLRTRTHL